MSQKLDPQHLAVWRLFITSHAKLIKQIDEELQAGGQIALSDYDVLIELYEAENQRLRMAELADKVVLSRSGLTRLVDRLEKQGYLQRELDPQDRRGFYAILTAAGINAMRGAWSIYAEGIQAHFAAFLSEEETLVLAKVLGKILAHFEADN